jgi:hypothetical protein
MIYQNTCPNPVNLREIHDIAIEKWGEHTQLQNVELNIEMEDVSGCRDGCCPPDYAITVTAYFNASDDG